MCLCTFLTSIACWMWIHVCMQAWAQGLLELPATDLHPWLVSLRRLVEHCVQRLAEAELLPLHAPRAASVLCHAATCAHTPPQMQVRGWCVRAPACHFLGGTLLLEGVCREHKHGAWRWHVHKPRR